MGVTCLEKEHEILTLSSVGGSHGRAILLRFKIGLISGVWHLHMLLQLQPSSCKRCCRCYKFDLCLSRFLHSLTSAWGSWIFTKLTQLHACAKSGRREESQHALSSELRANGAGKQ